MRLPITTSVAPDKFGRHENYAFMKASPKLNSLQQLTETERQEVLEFLKLRPVQTVVLASFIQDNGMESADNRGKFYGYRNAEGILEGVALIGHTTLVESRSENSLMAFALAARSSETPVHVMMSDGKTIDTFWQHYAGDNSQPRLTCNELLFELEFPFLVQECKWNVRLAKAEELVSVAEAHAEVAFIESGVDPMLKDREGFLKRTLRRIEQERTFVVYEGDKLVFKADIVAETADVIYLEGIYVSPDYRGQGVGSSCLSKLSLDLLERVEHICLLSNVDFKGAHRSFLKAGYKNTDCSTTMFV
ncbi:MAG: GNAT family N-acetyltransferase [Acidobacteriota bacterium]|nr:GNAT family N-acetyltransferase [Acidobacteriota bacterium]